MGVAPGPRRDDGRGRPTRRDALRGAVVLGAGVTSHALPTALAAASSGSSPAPLTVADAGGATAVHTGNVTVTSSGTISSHSVVDGTATGNSGRLGNPLVTASILGLDADTQWVYYAAYSAKRIGRIRVDGTDLQDSFITLTSATGYTPGNPTAVVVSSTHVYWTESSQSRIGRARIDGTEVEPLWRSGLPHPAERLALTATHLYFSQFANANTTATNQGISRIDLATGEIDANILTRTGGDGTSGSKLTPDATPAAPVDIVVTATHLYVLTFGDSGWIARADLDGGGLVNDWARNTHAGSPTRTWNGDTDGVHLYCNAGTRVTRVNLTGETRTWTTLVSSGASDRGLTLAPKSPVVTTAPAG